MRASKIREFVEIVQESGIAELEIRSWWGKRIRIRKHVSVESVPAIVTAPSEASVEPVLPSPPPPAVAPQESATVAPTETAGSKQNVIEFKAPMVGTFYRAPAPDTDPYIQEGDQVSPGKVLCIIEAMKLMNEIEAEVSGKIVKILVENAQPVEYNQPLFLIES